MFVLNRWCTSASADSTVSSDEVEEERRDLARRQHALVDQRSRRQADDVERLLRLGREPQRVDRVLDPLADHVQLALERVAVGDSSRRGAMKSCRKTGSAATARGPSSPSSVGTSRQPSTRCPSSPHDPLDRRFDARARVGLLRQEDEAGAVRALGGERRSAVAAASLRKNRSGIWMRMPAPSPVLASQPQAPRCSRLISTWRAWRTIACERCPLAWTTKPTPQASCSWRGS